MGTRGPLPKRSEERRRRNTPERPVDRVAVGGDMDDLFGPDLPDERVENRIQVTEEDLLTPAERPDPDPAWHPTARMVYDSLSRSGQKVFYEASDWAVAYLLCESISRDLEEQVVGTTESGQTIKDFIPMKGASLSSYLKGFATLGMTEGDRRRMSIELTRADQKNVEELPEGVTNIDDARRGLLG